MKLFFPVMVLIVALGNLAFVPPGAVVALAWDRVVARVLVGRGAIRPNDTDEELEGGRIVTKRDEPLRMRIVVSVEETGEELAVASGVETLILLVAPDTYTGGKTRRILLGDAETSAEMLFDILDDVTAKIQRGTVIDLSDVVDDRMLLEVTEGLPLN